MGQQAFKALAILFLLVCIPLSPTWAHSKDVSLMTINIDATSLDGELFLHGFEVARLAQQFNLDPSQLTEETLRTLMSNYFNIHVEIRGGSGPVGITVIDFKNIDPGEFLATGLTIVFFAQVRTEDFPLTFFCDVFCEFSSTQTNKLLFFDKSGKPWPNARPVMLSPQIKEFVFDKENPDFSAYGVSFQDSDGDDISDPTEIRYGLDPVNKDSDGDGISDFEEFFIGWDPLDPDPAWDQEPGKFEVAVAEFAQLYRRKPTEESFLLSLPEEAALKETTAGLVSATVRKVLSVSDIDPATGPEHSYVQELLGKMEADLFLRFDMGSFLFLLVLTAGFGFFHAGSSGAGKGIALAYCFKDDREIKHALFFSFSYIASLLAMTAILAFVFFGVASGLRDSLAHVSYGVQAGAGGALALLSVFLIIHALRKIKAKIVIGKKTFFDGLGGAILFGGLSGLAACPFLMAFLRLLVETDNTSLAPFFFLAFGIGVFVCIFLVALAILAVRLIFLDILPRLILYSELVSSCALFLFSGLFFLKYVPF